MKNPFSAQEAERALLACLLTSSRAYDKISPIVNGEMMSKENAKIYSIICDRMNRGEHVDLVTIGGLYGDVPYIAGITDCDFVVTGAEAYARDIRTAYKRKSLHTITTEITGLLRAGAMPDDTIEALEAELTKLHMNSDAGYFAMKKIIHEAMDDIEKNYKNKGNNGVELGLSDIDHYTMGLRGGDLMVIGARPSVGKTAFALKGMLNITRHGVKCGFFSMEMPRVQLAYRMLSGASRVGLRQLRTGMLQRKDFPYLTDAATILYDAGIYVYDEGKTTIDDIRSKGREMVRKDGVGVLFVDHLGLIKSMGNLPRHEQMKNAADDLKDLGKELDIPIVALSQVGRQAEGRMPNLSDLRESGGIEEAADIVMFLHRDTDLTESERTSGVQNVEFSIPKNRNGETGGGYLIFTSSTASFDTRAKT